MRQRVENVFVWVLLVLVCLWFLYLAYRVAVHVQAWPFGQ